MSTATHATNDFSPPIGCTSLSRAAGRSRTGVLALAAAVSIAGAALALRAWDIGTPYASGDQAVLGYLVRHNNGITWIFERNYGPVTEGFNRAFAGLLSLPGLPMSEATERLPAMLVGLAQVLMTYPLLRRMRRSQAEALAGCAAAVVLPVLVTDCRLTWAWGYLSIWLLAGTIALWATLAWLDDRKWWQPALAAGAIVTHCLSNVYSFALPATLMVFWACTLRRSKSGNPSPPSRDALPGFVWPCVAAMAVIVLCWVLTGHGQIGHLLTKQQRGTAGLQLDQITRIPAMWATVFGYLSGLLACVALIVCSLHIPRG
ncbi:MAG TPA: hypothetical protein VLM89_14890, partial [Phycisphaerae bacterium]|nr:hypothetical protein [Phycisphaerae bacterium]